MFFIFDTKKPIQLFFYVFLIVIAIVFEYLDIAPAQKIIGAGILAVIIVYVLKTLLGFNCCNKNKEE